MGLKEKKLIKIVTDSYSEKKGLIDSISSSSSFNQQQQPKTNFQRI
jgi:hypothetical protein